MVDAELQAFVQALEAWFTRHRGREHVLSPQDFSLARGWHAAGVSLAEVLTVLDEAAGSGEAIGSLGYCRRRLEARRRQRQP